MKKLVPDDVIDAMEEANGYAWTIMKNFAVSKIDPEIALAALFIGVTELSLLMNVSEEGFDRIIKNFQLAFKIKLAKRQNG